jgi:hypothetical protein
MSALLTSHFTVQIQAQIGDKFAQAWGKQIMFARAYTFQATECFMEAMMVVAFELILATRLGQ